MSVKSAVARALENFDPSNPFHVALKKYGEYNYVRVIERASDYHRELIANGQPVVNIAESVRQKALEYFADDRYMRGMQLEEDLGL
jgi:hypothetical protein